MINEATTTGPRASTSKMAGGLDLQSRTIALLLPTLNELEGLKTVLPLIDRSLVDDVVVIDGGSRDGTVEFALDAGLTVVSQLRPGLHFAVFDVGQALPHDFIIEFSPDGNCKADQLPELVAKLREGYDHVVVSRGRHEGCRRRHGALVGLPGG